MPTVFAFIALLTTYFPQTSAPEDPLFAIRFMTGRWTGTGSGEPGTSVVDREYRSVLGGKFIHGTNTSTWAPLPASHRGEVHQDWSFFSFDRGRKRVVLRQFHVEGFVNQYVLDPSSEPGTLVFVSESIENIAAGWRARETYRKLGDDEFEETFDLAAPGKEFELYSKTRLRRVKP
jgi:hypothetical protein